MHSPFAGKFLEALRSYGVRENIITLPKHYGWLERISPEPRTDGFGRDEPGSDFVFVSQGKKFTIELESIDQVLWVSVDIYLLKNLQ